MRRTPPGIVGILLTLVIHGLNINKSSGIVSVEENVTRLDSQNFRWLHVVYQYEGTKVKGEFDPFSNLLNLLYLNLSDKDLVLFLVKHFGAPYVVPTWLW